MSRKLGLNENTVKWLMFMAFCVVTFYSQQTGQMPELPDTDSNAYVVAQLDRQADSEPAETHFDHPCGPLDTNSVRARAAQMCHEQSLGLNSQACVELMAEQHDQALSMWTASLPPGGC